MTYSRVAAMLLFAGSVLAGPLVAQQREISFESAGDFLSLPADTHFGEVAGVATTSKGTLLVYYQSGGPNSTIGASRVYINGGPRLLEFDRSGKFLREIGSHPQRAPLRLPVCAGRQGRSPGQHLDRGPRLQNGREVRPPGRVLLTLGRRLEAIGELGSSGVFGRASGPPGSGVPGDNFNQPTDVAWDAAGNIFVSDGYGNARVAKFDKNGRFVKSWGATGTEPGKFDTPHSVAVDAKGNVYVADMGNQRIQVFDNDGTFKTEIKNVGAPRAICISPGAHQFLYSSNSNPTEDPFLNGEIYKMELDGTVLGRIGRAGKQLKEFGMVNEIDCRDPNTLYVAELMNWRVQKLTLHN